MGPGLTWLESVVRGCRCAEGRSWRATALWRLVEVAADEAMTTVIWGVYTTCCGCCMVAGGAAGGGTYAGW